MSYIVIQQTTSGSVATPSAGKATIFVDSADGLIKSKNSEGTVTTVGNVKSVAGKTGEVTLSPGDVEGLIETLASKQDASIGATDSEVNSTKVALESLIGAKSSKTELAAEVVRAETAEALKLAKSSNLSDLSSVSTARTNLSVLSTAEVEALVASKGGVNKSEVETISKELSLAVFNVKHYGAKGTGSGNDSVGIMAAIEAAEAAGGGIIYFPPCEKYYRLESKITYKLSKQIHFLGSYQAAEIRLVTDLEYGEPIIGERGTEEALGGPNIKHIFAALFLVGPKTWPNSPSGGQIVGYAPSKAMGLECCGNAIVKECLVEGFYAGYYCREFGQKFTDCVDLVNLYGTYIGPNNLRQPFIKGGVFRLRHESFANFARFAVHPCYISEGATFDQEGGSNEPYCFYKEAPAGVTGAFIQSSQADAYSSQATGNAVIYDENCASSFPSEYFKEPINFGLNAKLFNAINFPTTRIGNVQLLDLSLATAGTFKIVIPTQKGSGAGAGNQFAGATTASIAFNASNSTIQTALNTALGSESTAIVSTRESKKQILITGKASLMAGTALTLETGGLTGSATIGSLEVDPNMGPYIKPTQAKILEVKNATGGTFTITMKIGGVEYTTAAIAYNATPQVVAERVWKAMGHPHGVIVGAVSTNGKYYLHFNGRSLGKSVEISTNIASLTGAGAEVVIANGAATTGLALRHAEYMIDGGSFELRFDDNNFTVDAGSVGFLRTKGELTGYMNERFAANLIGEIASGEMIMFEVGGTMRTFTMTYKGAFHRLVKITGEIKKGQLLATKSGQEAEVYPTGSTPPAAGFAVAAVPAATTRRIPVRVSGPPSTNTSDGLEPEYSGSAPANNAWLKPSTETKGSLATGTLNVDYIIGCAVATGSGGKVKIQPRGLT